jgi:hypothetical protein
MGSPDGEREVDLTDEDAPLLPEHASEAGYLLAERSFYGDTGWGSRSMGSDNDYRLLEDRPPHWG